MEFQPYPGSVDQGDPAAAREWVLVVRHVGTPDPVEPPAVSAPVSRRWAESILDAVAPGKTLEIGAARFDVPDDAQLLDAGPDRRYAYYAVGRSRTPRLLSVEICRLGLR